MMMRFSTPPCAGASARECLGVWAGLTFTIPKALARTYGFEILPSASLGYGFAPDRRGGGAAFAHPILVDEPVIDIHLGTMHGRTLTGFRPDQMQ